MARREARKDVSRSASQHQGKADSATGNTHHSDDQPQDSQGADQQPEERNPCAEPEGDARVSDKAKTEPGLDDPGHHTFGESTGCPRFRRPVDAEHEGRHSECYRQMATSTVGVWAMHAHCESTFQQLRRRRSRPARLRRSGALQGCP